MEYAVDLSYNRMSPERFPIYRVGEDRRERSCRIIKKSSQMEPSPCWGVRALREAVAEHLKPLTVACWWILIRSWSVPARSICIVCWSSFWALIKSTAWRIPGTKKSPKMYKQCGVTCRCARLDDQGITVDPLRRSGADIAHISPNHHFPTGITMPASRRYEVLAWANEKEGRYLIEDDYDSEFRLGGRPVPTLFSIDACEKVIYMNTFSKSLTPTIRISYMVLPVHLANRFYEELSFYSCTVSNFEQYTLAAFIKQGYFEKHINRMRLYYARQRQKIKEVLEKGAPGLSCEILENDSGLHLLLQLNAQCGDRQVKETLARQGIRIETVSDHCLQTAGQFQHQFLINYSCIDLDRLDTALAALRKACGFDQA